MSFYHPSSHEMSLVNLGSYILNHFNFPWHLAGPNRYLIFTKVAPFRVSLSSIGFGSRTRRSLILTTTTRPTGSWSTTTSSRTTRKKTPDPTFSRSWIWCRRRGTPWGWRRTIRPARPCTSTTSRPWRSAEVNTDKLKAFNLPQKAFSEMLIKEKSWARGGVVMWSAWSPSTMTIRVWIHYKMISEYLEKFLYPLK